MILVSKFLQLFLWMPSPMRIIVIGLISLFLIWSILKIIAMVMDIIPFI